MIYSFPIYLEDSQTFTSHPTKKLRFQKTNGRDGNNVRITNIVGYENGDFLKWCPCCKRIRSSQNFGLRLTENKDQSYCTDCR